MSGPSDNDDSDQEMLEFSDDEETEDEIEDEGFLHPPIDNPVDEQSSRLAEASFGGGFGLVETNQEAGTVAQDQIIGSDDMPPEFQGFENQMGSDSRPDELLDVDAGKDNEASLVKLENGSGVLVEDAKAVNSEDDHLMVVSSKQERTGGELTVNVEGSSQSHTLGTNFLEGDDSGNEEEQSEFMKELENFHKERSLEFKPPRFYGEGLNCLKLWRAVAKLGGYEQVTSCKLWRQVGETFKPPKTCTTVSWTFRIFYEKALLEYEKHKIQIGELNVPVPSVPESVVVEKKVSGNQTPGTGRARRDAAARAMQGWHSHRFLSSEAGGPVIKDKNLLSLLKRDKHLKSIGALKRKKASSMERSAKIAHSKSFRPQGESMVVDVGEPADWVKINVRRTKDCFEVYALVPGLLREEVHVQSDPGGRLIISGEPEQPDNPWGVTSFKKVITLPSRIDPHQTSAVVTLHGQLFVRAPFEQSDL